MAEVDFLLFEFLSQIIYQIIPFFLISRKFSTLAYSNSIFWKCINLLLFTIKDNICKKFKPLQIKQSLLEYTETGPY